MSSTDEIFSLRLVVADFYMEKPIQGLDACYSEFRGKEIKRVPVIRIFGCNSEGQKTCMHVHGVFPYFYIPYDQKDFESLNQAIYQIAINLDKAINISLSQGSSSVQHVFKVQLVKGIPFYGYHRSDHQFLKIYMFNPRFVRRAANLLQNGVILNKHFHPHESHVPYILQFMIDYNLYGMSFLHAPLEIVKFRCSGNAEEIPFKKLKPVQVLDFELIKKVSCSSIEVDIASNFILNRFQLIAKTNTSQTNPGIEAIWHDERLRREKLAKSLDEDDNFNVIPPLEVPRTQERPDIQCTESEVFHRTALLNKLLAMEASVMESAEIFNQTLDANNISKATIIPSKPSFIKRQKRTFNLAKILQNCVYPEECIQSDHLINASFIPNHLNSNNTFDQSLLVNSNTQNDKKERNVTQEDNIFMEDTAIDEELLLSLTQIQYSKQDTLRQDHVPLNATLREEDMELLDILQQLEENGEDKIDLDSSLAPLSQTHKNFALSPQELDKETTAAALQHCKADSDSEEDMESDDNLHDFSIALENVDDLILKLTQSQKGTHSPNHKLGADVPQVDGTDDLLKTPTKSTKLRAAQPSPHTPTTPTNRRLYMGSPRRSPRTPKNGHKYTPLPLVAIDRATSTSISVNIPSEQSSHKHSALDRNSLPTFSLRKKLAPSYSGRKSISVDTDLEERITGRTRSKRLQNLDKTHITCALTPRRTKERFLKVYNVGNISERTSESKNEVPLNNQEDTLKSIQCNNTKAKVPIVPETIDGSGKSTSKDDYVENQKICSTESKSDEVAQNNCQTNSKSNGLRNVEDGENAVSNSESDEEIIDSDNDLGTSLKDCQQIRNLKPLRRSFSCLNPAKRQCVTRKLTNATSNSSEAVNYSVKEKADNKSKTKLRQFKIKIRRVKKNDVREQNANDFRSESKESKLDEDNCRYFGKCQKDINSKNLIEIRNACTNSERTVPAEESKEIHLEKNEIEEQKSLSQNLENLQEALKLHLQSTKAFGSTFPSNINGTVSNSPPKNKKTLRHTDVRNKSLNLQSPILFAQSSSPTLLANAELEKSKTRSGTSSMQSEAYISISSSNHSVMTPETKVILTPLELPPSREEVLKGCQKLQLPEYEFQQPFYSNPDDITKTKELGFTILQIPGNKLNDVEEFKSILGPDLKGLTAWRRDQLIRIGGIEMLNKYRNTQRIREYFANQKSVIITLQYNVPTRQEAKLWLKARELLKSRGEDFMEPKINDLEEDSPIKVRRQKVTMMLNAEGDNADSEDILNCTSRSLTLTPLTPATPVQKELKIKPEQKQNHTPVSRSLERISLTRDVSLKKRRNCRVLKNVSVNKQLKEAFEKAALCNSKQHAQERKSIKESQATLPDSQKSETSVSSETALAELDRSSFMRQVKESHVSQAGCTDNSALNNTFGFKVALENLQQAKADVELNCLTIVTLEIFVATREDLHPNPELDEIRCLFYAIQNNVDVDQTLPRKACGYIMVHDNRDIVVKEGRIHGIDTDIEVTVVQTEVEALEALLGLCSRWDPDIYAGYEIEMLSWGYVIERAKYLCLNIAPLLSRVPTQKVRDFVDEDRESFTDLDVEMKLCGRILLDVWRLLRSEIALTSYTFENVMYHIMHKRCPWHSYRNLTEWFVSPCSRWIVIEYYLERVRGTLALLDQLDLVGRTSEMAKLIGIQFYEVLSRGSQFRVESMMLRIAKPRNLVPLSPSVQQRAHMRAPEYLPLIMEPQSRFYADPMIVLDFQSLYPSMIIAYNYCFSTCLGRVEHLGESTPFEFGASQLRVSPAMLRQFVDRNLVTISPCGAVFVKSSVREGILPRMLTEILDTRQMVKQSMKVHKSNTALQRILHSRQLGLKLMANVTYGYTAANFSGRMPAVEVGDSVVSKGRETLERAIKMVEANDQWNVRVVYGDTDSMFVLVPGRSRDEAFRIGTEIAEAVTQQNPHPVKLKLEKVYQPCILQTKKRYVGYMYETPDQKDPIYEAKGIETVRRDGCPIVAKMLEKVLRILFESADVSQVKNYVCRQFTKLLSGRANLQDLIFAKEFRGLNGYRPTACVPALEMTRKWIQTDPRRVPRRGERVPFIITNGPPGVPLIRLVRHPHEVLRDEGLKVNAVYYITKAIIPPLNRCLLLIGADVNEWFANLPRKILLTPAISTANEVISCYNSKCKKSTISQFFSTINCVADCGRQTKQGVCAQCSNNPTRSVVTLQSKISQIERSYLSTQHICQACCGRVGDLRCDSLDCPVLYVLEVKRRDLKQIVHFRNLIEEKFDLI